MHENQYTIKARRYPTDAVELRVIAKRSGSPVARLVLKNPTPDEVKTAANTLMELWLAGLAEPMDYVARNMPYSEPDQEVTL